MVQLDDKKEDTFANASIWLCVKFMDMEFRIAFC